MSQKNNGKRVQKNLRVSEEHAEALEKMASDLFNSEKKQGQVVEELINLTEYAPQKLDDIVDNEAAKSSRVDVGSQQSESPSNHTHTQNSSETSTTSEENQEVSIENMKGRNVDHADVIYDFLKEKGDVMGVERATEIVEDKAGYSRYRAKQKAKKAVRKYDYKVDTEKMVNKYKELILNDYTNLMGNHIGGDISTSKEARISEFQNKDVRDLFGVDHEVKYTDTEVVAQKLIEDWRKDASKSIDSGNEKVLKKAVSKVMNND